MSSSSSIFVFMALQLRKFGVSDPNERLSRTAAAPHPRTRQVSLRPARAPSAPRSSLQAAGNRAEPGVESMHALGILPPVSGHAQAVVDGDSLDHQHVVLGFNLANRLYLEAVPLDFDLTRFQRAGKGAGQSAAGRGYHVVERRRMRRELLRRNVVMLGNLRVDAEQ